MGASNGGLAKVTDSETGITSTYYYDIIDRLCHYTEATEDYSLVLKYTFDEMDQVNYIEEIIDGSARSSRITYDDDQRVKWIRKGSVKETYTYDAYSRVTNKATTQSDVPRLTEQIVYRIPTTNTTSGQVSYMTVASAVDGGYSNTFSYSYDASGTPMSVYYAGTEYYYVTNIQGDVVAILDYNGAAVVTYTYDAWGQILSIGGAMVDTLGKYDPLRYRGYVYDVETELYYLQSRYYDPGIGRFINTDGYDTTGQNVLGNNMFAYCGNDPTNRVDSGGFFWDTALDVVSLGVSIADVFEHSDDPMAWLGAAADAASLLIPCISGGGALVKVATKTDDLVDTAKAIDKVDDAADATKAGWRVGDDITKLTRTGSKPKWSTVRQRYWKNEALFNGGNYSEKNLALMKAGRAPLVELAGKFCSMELHHITPRSLGGSDAYNILLKVTPWDHDAIDPYRHFSP